MPRLLSSRLFPYTTLFRSLIRSGFGRSRPCQANHYQEQEGGDTSTVVVRSRERRAEHLPGSCSRGLRILQRSEEHTSELQSLRHLVCRLTLEKKKTTTTAH